MKIALIDDELDTLAIMKDTLKPTGYLCHTFNNPITALEEIKKSKYDIIVTDIKMPELNGIEVLKSIKKDNSDSYVIVITGYSEAISAVEALKNGAYAFFRKPLSFQELIEAFESIAQEMEQNSN